MPPSSHFDENMAWSRLRKGDESAFYQLYKHYFQYLLQIGYRICEDPGLAKDAIHDYFLYLWERRDNLPEVRFVTGYIAIAYKRMLLETTGNKKNTWTGSQQPEEDAWVPSYEEIFTDRESLSLQMDAISQAIQHLPQRQRELMLYRYYLGLSHDEIADRTGLSLRSIYNQLNIALSRLRKTFADDDKNSSFPLFFFFL